MPLYPAIAPFITISDRADTSDFLIKTQPAAPDGGIFVFTWHWETAVNTCRRKPPAFILMSLRIIYGKRCESEKCRCMAPLVLVLTFMRLPRYFWL